MGRTIVEVRRLALVEGYIAIIWDTDPGSRHIVVYRSGLLLVPVPFWNRVLFAARYARGGGGPARVDGRCPTREERRMQELLRHDVPTILGLVDGTKFVGASSIEWLRASWRVVSTRLEIATTAGRLHQSWTPSMNNADHVRSALAEAFADKLQR
jgi:hypothetical protein